MTIKKSIGGHEKSGRGEVIWLTPPEIISALGPFDLDPCYSEPRPWPTASEMYGPDAADGLGGLLAKWHGFVWCNPPYDKFSEAWLERLADHGNGIALVMARTETKWFQSQIWQRANCVFFPAGRLSFRKPDGRAGGSNAGAPIVFAGYGKEAVKRLKNYSIKGKFIHLTGNKP